MKELRIKNSMKKIYQTKCYPADEGLLMQISRDYAETYNAGDKSQTCRVNSFKSLIRINGKWTLDMPYYCYAGTHRYRPVPRRLSYKLDAIATLGAIKSWRYRTTETIKFWIYKTWQRIC